MPAFVESMLLALEHFKARHGLEFTSLSPFNEPGSPAWISPIAVQEGCYFSHRRMEAVRGAGEAGVCSCRAASWDLLLLLAARQTRVEKHPTLNTTQH